MNLPENNQTFIEEVHSIPDADIVRFWQHPENVINLGRISLERNLGDTPAIGNDVPHVSVFNSKNVEFDGEQVAVSAILIRPFSITRAFSRLQGKEPQGHIDLTIARQVRH